jgi:hypothetical protein
VIFVQLFMCISHSWEAELDSTFIDLRPHLIMRCSTQPHVLPSMNSCMSAPPNKHASEQRDVCRPELWYWEAARQLQLLTAVALVVVTPLLPLSAQAALLLLLFSIFTFSHVVLVPFKDTLINTLEFSALVTMLVNISAVLLISGGAMGGDGSRRSILLALAVLAINIALVACMIYCAIRTQLPRVRHFLYKKWAALMLLGQKLLVG